MSHDIQVVRKYVENRGAEDDDGRRLRQVVSSTAPARGVKKYYYMMRSWPRRIQYDDDAGGSEAGGVVSVRRGLVAGEIGSTPPKCMSKCSKCTPCTAVRVAIQPGRSNVRLMEYYPEAWRCKCRDKIYMP